MKNKKVYDLEFKKDVVRHSYESGKSVSEICEAFDVPDATFYRWRKELVNKGIVKVEQEVKDQGDESRKLRKELLEVKTERDILKKAMVIFAVNKK